MSFIDGNQIQLLCNGAQYFPALEQAIQQAQHEIYIQTYIYEADTQGLRIAELLKQAVQRQIKVRLLVDGFGSKDLAPAFVEQLIAADVECMFFRPQISPWTFQRKRLRRLHHKIVVIDGSIAFVGGINIIDDANVPHRTPPRIDYAVRVEGALLAVIHRHVSRLWRHVAWRHFKSPAQLIIVPLQTFITDGMSASFVVRDNLLHRRDIEKAYMTAIAAAKSEIIIANAYFIPGRSFRQALIVAAQRGVKVTLLLQGRMEYLLMFATHAFYNEFLSHGIQIYEYRKSFMHSKVAVIDGIWATVGSSNIDPFSLLAAREANVLVKNKAFAMILQTHIMQSIDFGAMQIDPHTWQRGHLPKRFFSWLIYGLLRLAMGLAGYSEHHR